MVPLPFEMVTLVMLSWHWVDHETGGITKTGVTSEFDGFFKIRSEMSQDVLRLSRIQLVFEP